MVFVKETLIQLSPRVISVTGCFSNKESLLLTGTPASELGVKLAQSRSPSPATCTVAGVWELHLEGWSWAAFLFIEPGIKSRIGRNALKTVLFCLAFLLLPWDL